MRSLLALAVVATLVFPSFSFAAVETIDDLMGIFCQILRYLGIAFMALSVAFVLLTAFYYLTSSGDPEKVRKANKTLTFTAVAIVVALFAWVFPSIVASLFNENVQNKCSAVAPWSASGGGVQRLDVDPTTDDFRDNF